MFYRKRAWDIMRSEYASVQEDALLSRVIQALEENLAVSPDSNFVLVMSKDKKFVGVISMWDIIRVMGPDLLKKAAKTKDNDNYEKSFSLACQLGAQTGIKRIIQKDIPRIKPNDTLGRIIEVFLDYSQDRAVVEEGGKIIGVVCLADVYREIAANI